MFEWDEQVGIQGGTVPVTWRNVNRWCQRKARYEMVDRVLPELTALRAGVHGACLPCPALPAHTRRLVSTVNWSGFAAWCKDDTTTPSKA